MLKLLILLLFSLSSSLIYAQALNDDLLLHYPFSGNTNDASGNGFHGVGNAIPTNDRFGNPNEAYYFNGTDSYIDFPNVSELKPDLPVSISFWVNFDDLLDENSTVLCTDFDQDNYAGVWFSRGAGGVLAVAFGDNSGGTSSPNRRTKSGNTPLNAGTWYHVAAVINGPTDMEIYIGCENDGGTYSGSGGPTVQYSSVAGSIGRKDANTVLPPWYFKGTIDDVRYWNRALTSNDIDTLCNNILQADEIPLENTVVTIYPNPAEDVINVQGTDGQGTDGIGRYAIHNSIGQKILEAELEQSQIDISSLGSGVYYIRFNHATKSQTLMFVKN